MTWVQGWVRSSSHRWWICPTVPSPSPAAQGHSSYLPGHLLIRHREAEGVRPWVQEVSGKHMVWGLALLGFPLQVNLLHL